MNILVSASVLSPLYRAFGWIMENIYLLVNNYGWALIWFTVLVRALQIPLSTHQHKTSLKQYALQPQLMELRRVYGNDTEAYSYAQMKLFDEYGVSTSAGCLIMIVQLVIMWPIYRVVSGPLHYMQGVPVENLQAIADIFVERGILASSEVSNVQQFNLVLNQALIDNPSILAEVVNQGLIKASDLINMEFLGLNLGLTPTISLDVLRGPERSAYLPLLIIPVLVTLTSLLPTWVNEQLDPRLRENKENRKRAKENPGAQTTGVETEQSAGCMKFFSSIMMLLFSFSMPAAMGLYWIVGNLMLVFQYVVLYFLYTKPFMEKKLQVEEQAAYIPTREEAAQFKAEFEAEQEAKAEAEAAKAAKQQEKEAAKEQRRKARGAKQSARAKKKKRR